MDRMMEKPLLKDLTGDGRSTIRPINPRKETFPGSIRVATARSLINHLLDTGYSWHSSRGRTLWLVEEFCQEVGLKYRCFQYSKDWTFYLVNYMRFRDYDWIVYKGKVGLILDCLVKPDHCRVQFDPSGIFNKVLHQSKLRLATDEEIANVEGTKISIIRQMRNLREKKKWKIWLENGFDLRTK